MAVVKNGSITKAAVDAVKTKVDQALVKTGKTYAWTQFPIAVGLNIETIDFTELRNATNIAYDNRANGAGHTSYNSAVHAANYSYLSSNNSNDSDRRYCGNHSYDNDRRSY